MQAALAGGAQQLLGAHAARSPRATPPSCSIAGRTSVERLERQRAVRAPGAADEDHAPAVRGRAGASLDDDHARRCPAARTRAAGRRPAGRCSTSCSMRRRSIARRSTVAVRPVSRPDLRTRRGSGSAVPRASCLIPRLPQAARSSPVPAVAFASSGDPAIRRAPRSNVT